MMGKLEENNLIVPTNLKQMMKFNALEDIKPWEQT
jgi:hypothetical protein